MLYLTTPSGPDVQVAMLVEGNDLGCMTSPAQGNRIPQDDHGRPVRWAADNGKFGKGWPGPEAWYLWLAARVREYGPERCRFAVAPDVPFNAYSTYHESLPWLPFIRDLGIPAAFAAQNGCEHGLIPWDDLDVLFLAGDTAWKTGPIAEALSREAKDRGKGVHMGRVNSERRLRIAEWFRCDSADGTYVAYGPSVNVARAVQWLRDLRTQPSLIGEL